jgi:hypothetical protein
MTMRMVTPRWWKVSSLVASVLLLAACGSTGPTETVNLTGTWSMVANTSFAFTLSIQQTGSAVTGTMHPTSPSGMDTQIAGTLNATVVSFTRQWSDAGTAYTQVYTGTVSADGKTMSGTFSHNGSESTYAWSAQR